MKFLQKIFNKSNGDNKTTFERREEIKESKSINVQDKFVVHELISTVPTTPSKSSKLCKSFLSEGMTKVGQEEICLTIEITEKIRNSKILDSDKIIPLFNTIYEYAKRGKTVTEGGFTALSKSANFLGFKGLVYSRNPEKPTDKVPDTCLFIILLREREIDVAMKMGYMRMLTMIGKETLQFPFPIWNDINRKEVRLLDNMLSQTILSQPIPKFIEPRISVYQDEERTIKLILPKEFRHHQATANQEILEIGHLTILPGFNLNLKFCKTWSSTKDYIDILDGEKKDKLSQPFGIMGCVFMVVGCQEENLVGPFEDGYSLLLTEEHWENFFEAYSLKKDFVIALEEKQEGDITGFKMIWKN